MEGARVAVAGGEEVEVGRTVAKYFSSKVMNYF
jgi:hypothetical protein